MTLNKRPRHPLPSNFVPEKSKAYRVKDKASWITIAKLIGINPLDLIYFNFHTTDPKEVNWYLQNRVGCKVVTKDKKNFRFSTSAKPGIIYVPIFSAKTPDPPRQQGSVVPPLATALPGVSRPKPPSYLRKIWAGIGGTVSGDFFVIGSHSMTGKIYNLGCEASQVKYAYISVSGYKFGPGLGGEVGGVLVIANGFEEAGEMNGVDGGWDFDISMGPKLLSCLKGVKTLGKIVNNYEKYEKLRFLTENALKNIGISKPGIYTIPIPAGGWGYHLWAGFKFGDVEVVASGIENFSRV